MTRVPTPRIPSLRGAVAASLVAMFTAAPILADGFIVVPPERPVPNGPTAAFPLEVRYHRVDVTINDMSALTSIDQEFYNPSDRRLEGTYLFPIPAGAVIDKFSMFIDGKETPAEMLDATKARTIYEDIVRRMIDPALLEYYGQGLFKARIFPIEPWGTKRVKISYRQVLSRDNGTIGYVYPLNTEKFSSAPLPEVAVRATIISAHPLRNVYCTSHDVEVVRKGATHAVVSFEASGVKPDKDFLLYYTTDKTKFGMSLLTHRAPGDDGYFFLNVSPDPSGQTIDDKDITFVLDVSGSMAGSKMDQARKALEFCIANLNAGDRFEIIRFSTEAEALFGERTKVDGASLAKARTFVRNLRAIGGTNIEEALSLALGRSSGSPTRRHIVLFMTDGKPTIGQTDESALVGMVKSAGKEGTSDQTRIFTLGIGEDLNTHLLDKITEATRAYRTYVGSDEDLEIKISDLYTRLQSPVLTDVTVEVTGGVKLVKTYPRELPDLFRGSSLTVLGRYTGQGRATVALTGMLKGVRRRLTYDCEFPARKARNEFIPALWAARRIGFLLDQIRLHGENRELAEEATVLAKRYGIITPYTSYLILEDEAAMVNNNRMRRDEEIFTRIAPPAPAAELRKRSMASFDAMKEKSGSASVAASKEVQTLIDAANTSQAVKDDQRMAYRDASGAQRNVTQQVKQIGNTAMYQVGKQWVDQRVQSMTSAVTRRIQFGSESYFVLIAKSPESARYLSLGRNVKFALGSEVIEVYE